MTEAEERIIIATVACIEEFGIGQTTIRRISDKAGMNNAAVNYYFRSKEQLMSRVMDATLDNAFRWEDFTHTEPMPLEQQLSEIFCFFTLSTLKFPRLSQAHLYDIVVNAKYDSPAARKLNAFLTRIRAEVLRKRPDLTADRASRMLIQLTTATLLYYSTCPDLFESFGGGQSKPETRQTYVQELVRGLLAA